MRPLNEQPVEKVASRADGVLKLVKVWPTLQGEGPFAGEPSIFVRLAGCNLQCPMCDTDYTSHWVEVDSQTVMTTVFEARKAIPACRLVVITGGEPFRQNIGPLLGMLLGNGFNVQIETNGTLFQEDCADWMLNSKVHVVCSPKTPRINEALKRYVGTLKYVLSADAIDPTDGLPTSVLGMTAPPARPWPSFGGRVYVQPCDDVDGAKNVANVRACVEVAMKFGYRMGMQLHKEWGVE